MVPKLAFNYNAVPKIRFGVNCLKFAKNDLTSLLGDRIMVITDPGLMELGLHLPLLKTIEDAQLIVFDEVEADPSFSTVLKAIMYARRKSVTGIVGFGGGSPMDVAKLTALVCGSNENLDEVWGVDNAKGPRLPLCLIPTTAGTGSEVTPISIVTLDSKEKRGVVSSLLLPDLAVLDPKLTLQLPSFTTAATGIDAMVHAIEAFTSKSPNNNILSRVMAKEALVLLNRSIRTAVENGKNIEARSDMLLGSMMAGMSFANSPVAAVHALAYPLGGSFKIPHGLSNALVLSEVLKFNSFDMHAAKDYANLAKIVCSSSKMNGSIHLEALQFSEYFRQLSESLGLPVRLRDLNIPRNDLEKLASEAMRQTRLLVNNPRSMNEADILKIYQRVW